MNYLKGTLSGMLDASKFLLSDIKPSEWAEKNRVMNKSVSPFPGKYSFDKTPYLIEIVNCLSPTHPARKIAVMKGAQIGFSTGVIENGIGWIISQNPANVLFLTGHIDLAKKSMNKKIDQMIESCGLRSYIRPNIIRARNMRTGDTSESKEFPGGSLSAGSATNHKLLRQESYEIGFIDDFEAVPTASIQSGDTVGMIEGRFAAYDSTMKLFLISTPEREETSNIKPAYLLGDQRRYFVLCPRCHEYIVLEWTVPINGNNKDRGGIFWKVDHRNKLVNGSVGYICQECAGFFNDSRKFEMNKSGIWTPTAEPSKPGYQSYHLSSLYAPPGMYDWEHYVYEYIAAHPPGQKPIERKVQTWKNLCLGETYEATGEAPKANDLQRNQRRYEIGVIPEKLSIKDGNGKIVLVTCACDMNGTENDARLDYEIVAYAESGSPYSITHGSIGTFVPREGSKKIKEDRVHWTYELHKANSVWRELDKIIEAWYPIDNGGKKKVSVTGVDCGHYTHYAYSYIDTTKNFVVGLKGKGDDRYTRFATDAPTFRKAKERAKLYLVEVGLVKDDLAEAMKLRYDEGNDMHQPAGFMNYPISANGKYLFTNYFSHYEGEHRILESKDGEPVAFRWVKKTSVSQNHFWDVRVYNLVLKDITAANVCSELKIKNHTWSDYVDVVTGKYEPEK